MKALCFAKLWEKVIMHGLLLAVKRLFLDSNP